MARAGARAGTSARAEARAGARAGTSARAEARAEARVVARAEARAEARVRARPRSQAAARASSPTASRIFGTLRRRGAVQRARRRVYPSGMLRRATVLEGSGFAAVAAALTGPGGRSAFSAPIRRGPRPMLQARGRSPGNEVGAADGAATSRKERFPPPCRRTAVGRFRGGALATAAAVQPRQEENVPRKAWGLVRAAPAGLLMRTRPPLW